ncbi:MAG: VTT domain-containing protein [Candidatus Pseudobacter hemicellulosilyticus]|uniref:TVP38/TMEM64 family membrane protein n=1 Tax=Candidatus Pseudobacter hemicellulosilyticus TaxID=3121375 RepID=A0AAJ5WWQ9_9BACT|nr:MAG: VTT domain-containing protein [Pseudobacter sp.]
MQTKEVRKDAAVKTSKAPIWIVLGMLALLGLSYWLLPGFRHGLQQAVDVLTSDDKERIQTWVSQFGIMGPILLVIVMMFQMFLFVVPNVLVMMIAITSYGPVWGSVISFVGVFASSSLGYLIGRYLSRSLVNRFVPIKTQDKVAAFLKRYGVPAIAITRLSSLSNDSLSFVAGILKMNYRKYILATMGGITPLIVLLAIYGKNGRIEKALFWIAGFSLVTLAAYIIIDKRRQKKAAAGQQPDKKMADQPVRHS